MAGTGPPPKPRAHRRGGKAEKTVKLPAVSSGRPAPALPRKSPAWLAGTRAWWSMIWRQPEAAAWRPVDHDALIRLARLKDAFDRGSEDSRMAAEIRQLEDRLGMSPMARLRLRWEIDRATEATTTPGDGTSADALRRRLRAV